MAGLILLTGATGYVGGRLLRALEERGDRVRCLSRRPDLLRPRVGPATEVVPGDVLRPETVRPALEGVDTMVYLVHSMGSSRPFAQADRDAARAVGAAAKEAGVKKIVYLGGLGRGDLSEHLESRHEVGRILRASGVPTVELRASIVVGSGSASFDMIRGLVERLPVMVTPRWVRTPAQPIAIEDVIAYLLAAIDREPQGGELFEIGGADVVSYMELMEEYGRQRGLHRLVIPVPVLSPRLSSLWLGLVTPVHAGIGKKLVDSLRTPTVVTDRSALDAFPVVPRTAAEAVARALVNEDREFAETRWSDEALPEASWGGVRRGSRLVDRRSLRVPVSPPTAFAPIREIGGDRGWYYCTSLWRLRGAIDWVLGGPGLRRGRLDPSRLKVGDTIDFWRVDGYEPDRLLRLRAEMKLPGRAWLQFEVTPADDGSEITQTAVFDPAGVGGLAYWYALWPVHGVIFGNMLRRIGAAVDGEPLPPAAAPTR